MALRALALLVLAQVVVAQSPRWSSIPTIAEAPTLEKPPAGCRCVDAECTKFDCGCVCNLRAAQCDTNCCCDPDCLPVEVDRFRRAGACLPEGPVNRTLRSCMDVDAARSLAVINPGPRMALERPSDAILCISVDNSPIAGTFLLDPGTQPADVLTRQDVAPAQSYKTPARPAAPVASTGYVAGDRIVAARAVPSGSGTTLRALSGGFWSLPAAGLTGACALSGSGFFPRFGHDVAPRQCSTVRPLSAQSCEGLGAARLLSALRLGASPQSVPSAPAGFVTPVLKDAWTRNAMTGALTRQSASAVAASGTWSAASCSCAGAVVSAAYTLTYDAAASTITAAAVSLVLADLQQPTGTAACGSVPVSAPFTVSVTFLPAAAPPGASGPRYDRSGAPGYRLGAPLLAGVLVSQSGANPAGAAALSGTDKLAIARSAPAGSLQDTVLTDLDAGVGAAMAGLHLRGPGPDGRCRALTGTGSVGAGTDTAAAVPVAFGQNLAVTCSLQLDEPSLASLCSTGAGAGALAYVGLSRMNASAAPGAAPVVPTHVAAFGSADPWKPWQWIPITSVAASPAAVYDAARGVCAGIPAGVDVELLWARVGEAGNPQPRVLAARVSYPTDTWTFAREDTRSTPDAGSTAAYPPQTFTLRSSVTWVEYPAAQADYVAPAPPIVPSVPQDLFYPFEQAGGAGGGNTVSGAAAAGPAAAVGLAVAAAAVLLALRAEGAQ